MRSEFFSKGLVRCRLHFLHDG